MTQEALKLALDALIWTTGSGDFGEKGYAHEGAKKCLFPAITAIKEALAQPEQEPVADSAFLERVLAAMEGVIDVADRKTNEFDALRGCIVDLTLMLHLPRPAPVQQEPEQPPQRKLLTDEEIDAIYTGVRAVHHEIDSDVFARAIEAKLKEKNT